MKIPKSQKTKRTKQSSAMVPDCIAADKYVMLLFVAGATMHSRNAVLRIRELCETTLLGRVELEVIDIYLQPGWARKNQIVATPTLIIQLPLPVRRFIGNLTNLTDLLSTI